MIRTFLRNPDLGTIRESGIPSSLLHDVVCHDQNTGYALSRRTLSSITCSKGPVLAKSYKHE
jgi:hypothetical protein